MSTDGGLYTLLQQHFNLWHWQRIETAAVGGGVPDLNYCAAGFEGWVEAKATDGWLIEIRPAQNAWIGRRVRAGGNVYIAARRQVPAGPRRGVAVDDMYIFCGCQVQRLMEQRVALVPHLGQWSGGPAGWDWQAVHRLLTSRRCRH